MEIIDAIGAFLSTCAEPISAIAGIVAIVKGINSAFRAFKNKKVKTPEPSKENQLDDCKTAQYINKINKRNSLIFQAKQDAKKRPITFLVNLVSSFCFFVALRFIFSFLYGFLPLIHDIDSWILALPVYITLPVYIVFFLLCIFLYFVLPIVLAFSLILSALLFLYDVPSWPDFKKKFRERKYFKQSMEKGYYLHISRAIDIASHFDTYLLFDADWSEELPKDKVIGAKRIDASICDMIEPYLSEKLVVFIYSQHGKASYEQTQEARTKYPYVYDLGRVCGYMRKLEIVAHQLYCLQDGKCLRLP